MSDTKTRADLAGLTATECAKACNIERCVISGRAFCLHPKKTPMPPALADKADVQIAYVEACEMLVVKRLAS